MKRCVSATFIVIILFALTACGVDSLQEDSSGSTPSAEPSTVEKVGPDMSISTVTYDSFATLCEWSNTIAKAKYISRETYNTSTDVFTFEVETDFTNTVDEEIMRVHESAHSSFIEGKSYYIFATGIRNALYPYVRYVRINPSFLLGVDSTEREPKYSFYNDYALDVADVSDFDAYIETEIIQPVKYYADSESIRHESVESAYENADSILLVTVTEVIPENKYVSTCTYEVDKVLKGAFKEPELSDEEREEIYGTADKDLIKHNTPGPAGAEVGDQLILLFRYDSDSESSIMYSGENFLFLPDSDGGKYILDASSK